MSQKEKEQQQKISAPKFFRTQNFFYLNFFQGQHFCLTQNNFWTHFFQTQNLRICSVWLSLKLNTKIGLHTNTTNTNTTTQTLQQQYWHERSPFQLAIMLVATINNIIIFFSRRLLFSKNLFKES